VFNDTFFLLSAALTLGGAFAVLYSKNLMHACLFLLGSLFGVSGLYACIGADFLAATQLVVYAGGVVILMLFAIMLTGGTSDKINKFGLKKIPGMGNFSTYFVAGISALVASIVALKIIASVLKISAPTNLVANEPTVFKLGVLLVTDHILAFEISSVLLLGALIGAAIISRPRREIHD
jgi:NADH-quinone oxidoreductase subunit J